MASLLITEKLYKITHFEILTFQTFSQQYVKQTLLNDILLPDFGFWLRQAYELIFFFFFTKPIILLWVLLSLRLYIAIKYKLSDASVVVTEYQKQFFYFKTCLFHNLKKYFCVKFE